MMTRNLKALGLALLAVFALSAVAASAASAQDKIVSEANSTIVTGTTEEVGFLEGQPGSGVAIECSDNSYVGTFLGKEVTEVTVHPSYNSAKCSAPFASEVVVTTDGCDFVLTGTTEETDTPGKHAKVKLECTAGKEIVVHLGGLCTLDFPEQTVTKGGAVYTNLPNHNGKSAITVNVTATNLKFTKTSGKTTGGNFCFLLPGNGTEGVLKEKIIATGFVDNGYAINATTHVPTTVDEGAQTGISVK